MVQASPCFFIHLRRRVRRVRQNAALTRTAVVRLALAEQDVAGHAPVRAPRVLDLPELVARRRVGAVANGQHAVVQVGTARRGHHAARV